MTWPAEWQPYEGKAIPRNAEILAQLAILLDRGTVIRTSEFARRTGVNQRTVQRYLAVIECFMPLEFSRSSCPGWRKVRP